MLSQLLSNAVGHKHTVAPVCYLHIPRSGGGAVNAQINRLYLDEEICRPGTKSWSWDRVIQRTLDQPAGCKAIDGPYSVLICPHIQIPIRYFTFLRDPLVRAVSHYDRVLSDKSHHLHKLACSLGSFGAYLRNEATQPSVVNCELRHLGATIDLAKLTACLASENLIESYLCSQLEAVDLNKGASEMLSAALGRLDQMCLVGLTERFDESLQLLCETFDWPEAHALKRAAASQSAVSLERLPASDLRLLKQLNEADLELYASAKARFERDWNRSRFVYPNMHAFVSYAQNAEDVLLHRALKHVNSGIYIDVGANDPTGDSVTKAFYERGWRGINIEPVASLHEALLTQRPRDTNINAAAGAAHAQLTLYEVPGTGLSTLDSEIAKRHREAGFEVTEAVVEVRTLQAILAETRTQEVHFLKIDVEGWELDVLRGMTFDSPRPWIIVVEATEPNTDIPSYQTWESLLLNHRYAFTYFDGLNRYYVAEEKNYLKAAFSRPVNSGDFYIRASEKQALLQLRESRWALRRQGLLMEERQQALTKVTQWAKDSERYSRSLEVERVKLNVELLQIGQARESERVEYAKQQVDHGDARSGEIYALQNHIDNISSARATENRNSILETEALKKRAIVAEEYAKSLEGERQEQQVAYRELQALRDREHVDAILQIEAQSSRAAVAEEYAQSLLNELDKLRAAIRTLESFVRENEKTLARLPLLEAQLADQALGLNEKRAELARERHDSAVAATVWKDKKNALDAQLLALTEKLREWEDKGKQSAEQLKEMLESNFRSSNLWHDEKQQLKRAIVSVENRLNALHKHWAVRYLVSDRFLDQERGT